MNTLTRVVTKKIAELLKEKGFDKPCRYLYNRYGNLEMASYPMDWNDENVNIEEVISAPSIFSVLEWFFERYKIWITVNYNRMSNTFIGKYEYLNEEIHGEFIYNIQNPFEMYLIIFEHLLMRDNI